MFQPTPRGGGVVLEGGGVLIEGGYYYREYGISRMPKRSHRLQFLCPKLSPNACSKGCLTEPESTQSAAAVKQKTRKPTIQTDREKHWSKETLRVLAGILAKITVGMVMKKGSIKKRMNFVL